MTQPEPSVDADLETEIEAAVDAEVETELDAAVDAVVGMELDVEPVEDPERDSTEPESDRDGLFTRMARGASERVLDVVQPDMVLDHVDINALLDRVDINALLDKVDLNAVLEKVDIDALLARADIDAIIAQIDVRAIVDRAGIPEIVAESTGQLGTSALDLFRKPLVGIDEIVFRGLNRLIGRNPSEFPDGPGELTAWVDEQIDARAEVVGRELAEGPGAAKTGRYGGPITRLLSFMLDTVVVTTGFTVIVAGLNFLIDLLSSGSLVITNTGLWYAVGLAVFAFIYLWFSMGIFGKTLGMTVLGSPRSGKRRLRAQGKESLRQDNYFPAEFPRVRIRPLRDRLRQGTESVARPLRRFGSRLRLGEPLSPDAHSARRLARAPGHAVALRPSPMST